MKSSGRDPACLRRRPRRGAAACLAAVLVLCAGAWWVCPSGLCRTPSVDAALLGWLSTWRSPSSDVVASTLTRLGSLLLLGPALLALVGWRLMRRQGRAACAAACAFGGAAALCQLFKLWVDRPRPTLFEPLGDLPADPSFPSAHAMQAAAGLMVLALAAPHQVRRPAVALAMAAALTVGATRLYLQVHFPSDVVCGLLAGWLWALGANHGLGRPTERRRS